MADLISIILPHGAEAAAETLPALETLLSRGERLAGDAYPWIEHRHAQTGSAEFPVAPYSYLGEGGDPDNHYWLCAEPVHLIADQDQVYLAAYGESLHISIDEAAALRDAFNALYGSDGWLLHTPSPHRWYLRLPQPANIVTTLPARALGCAIRPLLPHGAEAMQWHAVLTEIEMLFHSSAVNAWRREQGMPVISGIWLWGGGVLPAHTPLRWDAVQCEAPWLRGMAMHAGRKWASVDTSASHVLDQTASHLMVFEPERHPLLALERLWFSPLLQALKAGKLQQLELHLATTNTTYCVTRRHLRRWWQRRQPWAYHVASKT